MIGVILERQTLVEKLLFEPGLVIFPDHEERRPECAIIAGLETARARCFHEDLKVHMN